MKGKIKKIINTKQFHIFMVIFIIFIILFIVGIISLRYSIEGEDNLPFYLSKISLISNVEGMDIEDNTNKWNLKVNQNNDVYLYIKRNENYKKDETIQSIELNNFNIEQRSKVGDIKLLKPDSTVEASIFKNIVENEVNIIQFEGSADSSIKDMKISNQGGLVIFRYVIDNIGNYTSNDDIEINHNELLKKLSVNNEDLKFKVKFDIYINLNSNKTYKANINLEFPVNNVVDEGTQSVEYNNLKNVIFKRI